MTSPRHKHTTVKDANGREICTVCHQVVVKPILSSDDPRLQGAGLMRSAHHEVEQEAIEYPPLPEMLVALYYNGSSIGVSNAPPSWYVHHVALEEGRRAPHSFDHTEVWSDLYRRWHEKCQKRA